MPGGKIVMVNTLSLAFYCASASLEVSGLALTSYDLSRRLRAIAALRLPVNRPIAFNWKPLANPVTEHFARGNLQVVEQRARESVNQLGELLRAEIEARETTDVRVAKLAGWTEKIWMLVLGAALLGAGALLGIAGNISGAV